MPKGHSSTYWIDIYQSYFQQPRSLSNETQMEQSITTTIINNTTTPNHKEPSPLTRKREDLQLIRL